jgi:GAF domain-containing protein/nitrogen-specific signal transduction histidine kinase
MSATPDSTLANPEQLIANLQRQLAEYRAESDEAQRQLAERTIERDEALARQIATAEVLQIINTSPGNVAPVFDAMLERAMLLGKAAFGGLFIREGDRLRAVATRGLPERLNDYVRHGFSGSHRLARDAEVEHIADLMDDPLADRPARAAAVELGGARTMLSIPLQRDGTVFGYFSIFRQEVRPFSEKQIALLQNFAAQAVIAMENARLLNETREALTQQTATAEVLQVINSSPGDLAPVFDVMLEKAMRLCEAAFGVLLVRDGDQFQTAALHGVPPAMADFLSRTPRQPGKHTAVGRMLDGEDVVQFEDMAKETAYLTGDSRQRAFVELGGTRTYIAVALRKDGRLVGTIGAYRQEVRPFSDQQIALLQNFAAQAVIAMENARLLTETREALEQQTATAEVLGVINNSPGDLAPVFDAMLQKACSLCEAAFGQLAVYEDGRFRTAATRGMPAAFVEYRRNNPPDYGQGTQPARLLAGERIIQVPDLMAEEVYKTGDPNRRALVDLGGVRSSLMVPLLRDDAVLGFINIYRREPRRFSEKQVVLLQNFAAQAVIAMENARLLTETREALEQQTATAEVLQVINSSPGDLTPVFDAILEKAHTLCGAAHGSLQLYDGENLHAIATHAVSDEFAEVLRQGYRAADSPSSRALIAGDRFVQIADSAEIDHPIFRSAAELSGIRTVLFVPLRRDDAFLGLISAARLEVHPFSDKQIALLQNFAAQAVIAMDNARLLTETREALAQQTATAEVLQVINESPGNLTPVFDKVLEKAVGLCEAAFGSMLLYDGERFNTVAVRGVPAAFANYVKTDRPMHGPGTGPARILAGERVVHIADLAAEEPYREGDPQRRALVDLGGARSLVCVPLLKDDAVLGIIAVYRQEVRPFSEKQIGLLQSFAAQAVIAMENARLLNELQARTRDLEESLEYQTATSDVLQVISRSTFDLQPVLDTLVETAARLCVADFGALSAREGDAYRVRATFALVSEFDRFVRGQLFTPSRATVTGRALLERETVHIPDASVDPELVIPEAVTIGRLRTMLGVPLLREGEPIGVFVLSRQRVEPFTERQIELVRTFVDQAVIAIENTRLLTELRESLEQQQAIAEVLQVINSSPGDLAPVFDAMLERAHGLCGASQGAMFLCEGEQIRAVATRGGKMIAERMRQGFPGSDAPVSRPLLEGDRFVHIADLAEIDHPLARAAVDLAGSRTVLSVPLRKGDALEGMILAARREVRAFSDKEIALLESFAAQAVIAMDNARLLEEIRQRQAELRVTFDNMGDGVAMFDSELRLAAWNMNFQHILDLPGELLAERLPYADYIRFLARRGEYGSTNIEAELNRRLEGLDQESRFEHTRPDGRVIEVRRNAVPGGGFVIIYGDVTERKRAEGEVRAARDTAERALEELRTAQTSLVHAQKMAALGQLTAGIAHEIKNPLNFVNNFAELSGELLLELKETTAPAVAALGEDERAAVDEVVEMLRGNLDKIAEHGKRADGIVKSMLEHSRGVSGERRTVDLNALIEEALNLAYHGARAQDGSFNVTLEREFDHSLALTELAPQEMTRVFLNLFGNGFYAITKRQRDGVRPDFRPTLKVATRDLGDAVEVRVRDNGTGIAPEVRDKLFQPFVTTKPTGEGTGLGLSIAYDIVSQQHGGTIEVDSRVGEFTEFTIRLPRTRLTTAEAVS